MVKKIIQFFLYSFIATTSVYGQSDTQIKLDKYQDKFNNTASKQKIKDYNEGIQQVKESGVLQRAKNIGDKAHDFSLPNALNKTVNLYQLLKKGPVVIIWYRGEWCPYCNIYLEDIQKHASKFNAAGAHIIAISPEIANRGIALSSRLKLKFEVLSDVGSKTAKEYGVIYTLPPKIANYLNQAFDLKAANKDDGDILPLSASYVINQKGVITYAYLNADYRKRADTMKLLDEVKKLTQRKVKH